MWPSLTFMVHMSKWLCGVLGVLVYQLLSNFAYATPGPLEPPRRHTTTCFGPETHRDNKPLTDLPNLIFDSEDVILGFLSLA